MRLFTAFGIAGAGVMAFFGSKLGEPSGVGSLTVAAFAVGILLMANAPVAALAARVRELEKQLAVHNRGSEPSSGAAAV